MIPYKKQNVEIFVIKLPTISQFICKKKVKCLSPVRSDKYTCEMEKNDLKLRELKLLIFCLSWTRKEIDILRHLL
jgi:hypothetical protein